MPLHRTAVIVLNWNSFEHTRNCLESLGNVKGEGFDLILIDNGSYDGSVQQIKAAFPAITLIALDKNYGFAGGNNIGLNYAVDQGYTYILMLNNDVFVEPDFLSPLLDALDQNPAVGAVQPSIFNHPERAEVWNNGGTFSRLTGTSHSIKTFNPDQRLSDVEWITGCAFLVRAEVLQKTGLLNEQYFAYYEDVDLSFRITAAGYQLKVVPQSRIYHIGGASSRAAEKGSEGYLSPDVHFYNIRNHIWIIRKWLKWYERPIPILIHLIYSLFLIGYFLVRLRWNKLLTVAKGFKDGFTLSGA
ncbi:MAG: hypothetical protein RL161_436 [Bacteroidota bacterium]|jgi:GT2 family glycosyltransferase